MKIISWLWTGQLEGRQKEGAVFKFIIDDSLFDWLPEKTMTHRSFNLFEKIQTT